MKPVIGITGYADEKKDIYRINNDYIDAVMDAGGLVINIPSIKYMDDYHRYLDIVDGLVFTGGGDLSPLYYGENPIKEISNLSNNRDEYEMNLFSMAYEKKIPVLGICRGMQIANVVLGGNLYQDIYRQKDEVLGHSPSEDILDRLYHVINIKEETIMSSLFDSENIIVNSLHHQAIKNLAEEFVVTSVSKDGIIESIESKDKWDFLGVQFHPEALYKKHSEFLNIFKWLIEVSKGDKNE